MSRRRSQRVVNRTQTLDKSKDSSRNRGDKDTCESSGECENPKRRRSRRNLIVEVDEHESNSNDSGLESASGGAEKQESLKTDSDSDEDIAQTEDEVSPIQVPTKRTSKRGAVKEKDTSGDKDDEFDETVPPLVDFMEILNVSPASNKSEKKCKRNDDNQSDQKLEDNQSELKIEVNQSDRKLEDDQSELKMEVDQSDRKLEDDQSELKIEVDQSDRKLEDDQSDQKSEDEKQPEQKMEESEKPSTTAEGPCNSEETSENGESSGKLRSSVSDAAGIFLAASYQKTLVETEEYALNYISQEFHHPVISCFRELNKADISAILGSKIKKSCNRLEQSIVYLGLIDYMATINNNPIYGEPTKMSKNVSGVVQKTLLEFKNIMGTWALSGDEQLSGRYSLILKYLRTLVPMFKKAGFDEKFSDILNRIEKEVQQHKINQEKIKSLNSASTSKTDSEVKLTASEEADSRTALNEVILNVDLTIKLDDSDDDDVPDDKETKNIIFGKPLKNTELAKKKPKKSRTNLDKCTGESVKSPKPNQLKPSKEKTPKVKSKSHISTTKKSTTSLARPKSLTKVSQSTNSPKTTTVKRSAEEDLSEENDSTKKRKTENGNIKINRSEGEPKSSIKNFFNQISSPSSQANVQNQSPTLTKEKQAVNAFALMMNRSREMAQKKKTDKMNAISVPPLKVDAVKS